MDLEDSETTETVVNDEVPKEVHDKLLSAVSQLYKKQRVEVPKRSEPHAQVSEFNLTTSVEKKGKHAQVSVRELAKVLNKNATYREIGNKVKSLQDQSRTLPKPLEKIHADKIVRTVGYKNLKTQMSRWDAVVQRNRAADQLKFPLNEHEVQIHNSNDFLTTFSKPTELELQVAEILGKSEVAAEVKKFEEDLFPLSVEEMVERRKMMARVRAQESYQIAKAARQNRIKSKKYHRIQKHERMKKELKEFEMLQKTDPQAALEKLQQLERSRAEERASLRHRSTGQWAKSKAIRAKYDKEARIELAGQLAKSRELTQKLKLGQNSSSDEEDEESVLNENLNEESQPGAAGEIDRFVSGYRKFWEGKNKENSEQPNLEGNKISSSLVSHSGNPGAVLAEEDNIEIVNDNNPEKATISENLNSDAYEMIHSPICETSHSNSICVGENSEPSTSLNEDYVSKEVKSNCGLEIEEKCDRPEIVENTKDTSSTIILASSTSTESNCVPTEIGINSENNSEKEGIRSFEDGDNAVEKANPELYSNVGVEATPSLDMEKVERVIVDEDNLPTEIGINSENKSEKDGIRSFEGGDNTVEKANPELYSNVGVEATSSLDMEKVERVIVDEDYVQNEVQLSSVVAEECKSPRENNSPFSSESSKQISKKINSPEREVIGLSTSSLENPNESSTSGNLIIPSALHNQKTSLNTSSSCENAVNIVDENEEMSPIIENRVVVKKIKDKKVKTVEKNVHIKGNMFCISTNLRHTKKRKLTSVTQNVENVCPKKRKVMGKSIEEIQTVSGNWVVTTKKHEAKHKMIKKDTICNTNLTSGDTSTSAHTKTEWSISNIFDNAENLIEEKIHSKLKKLQSDLNEKEVSGESNKSQKEENVQADYLSMKKLKLRSDVDEAMIELANDDISNVPVLDTKRLLDLSRSAGEQNSEKLPDIDPKKFLKVKPKKLLSQIPDIVTTGEENLDDEEEEETNRNMNLIEAFAEDDIVGEFRNEKKENVKQSKSQDIDLTLPGWGTWGGSAISPVKSSRRRRRRMILKVPDLPRRDKGKDNVIINEDGDKKLKDHLVSELPYPFTSVKDYEASIRAPIGNTWIPQTAHKKLVELPVLTRMGVMIKPMTEKELVDRNKKGKNVKLKIKSGKSKIK